MSEQTHDLINIFALFAESIKPGVPIIVESVFWVLKNKWKNTLSEHFIRYLLDLQSHPKVLEQPIPLYTEYILGWDKKKNTRQKFRISAFISWCLHLDVLNIAYLVSPNF